MSYLDKLPADILQKILKRLDNPDDLANCSLAHSRLDAQLQKRKIFYLFPLVFPLIKKYLLATDLLTLAQVCPEWKERLRHFDKRVPGRLPYDDELYLRHMTTLGKDPAEHKWNTELWFLNFSSVPKITDVQDFEDTGIEQLDLPFGSGTSACFDIRFSKWQAHEMFFILLPDYLRRSGQHFLYVKVKFRCMTTNEDLNFVRRLLKGLPNARSIELEGEVQNENVDADLIPPLPNVESLSFSFGNHNFRKLEGGAVARHARNLKRVKLAARPGNLPRHMPNLVELHIRGDFGRAVLEDLKRLQAPRLQKLTLELLDLVCPFDSAELLETIVHLPLRHLTIKWGRAKLNVDEYIKLSSIKSKFKTLQFPSLHTFTIYDFPGDSHSFLVCFPSLIYLNIRITTRGTIDKNFCEVLQHQEELENKKNLCGEVEKWQQFMASSGVDRFPELKQVSIERWKICEDGAPGKLLYGGRLTRSAKESNANK